MQTTSYERPGEGGVGGFDDTCIQRSHSDAPSTHGYRVTSADTLYRNARIFTAGSPAWASAVAAATVLKNVGRPPVGICSDQVHACECIAGHEGVDVGVGDPRHDERPFQIDHLCGGVHELLELVRPDREHPLVCDGYLPSLAHVTLTVRGLPWHRISCHWRVGGGRSAMVEDIGAMAEPLVDAVRAG